MVEPAGHQIPAAGRLLVASPLLPDPNFDRTVVLMLGYSDEGALGLVLNRPSETRLSAPLPRWAPVAAAPAVVFVGGPVQHQQVICLARAPQSVDVDGWRPVTDDLGTVDLDIDPRHLENRFDQVRVFAGYAGWAAGQLEAEIAAEAWWVVDSDVQDAFSEQPEQLWTGVLKRQPGWLKVVASYPADPMQN